MEKMIKISNDTKLMLEMVNERFAGAKVELAQAHKVIDIVKHSDLFKVAYVATGHLISLSLDQIMMGPDDDDEVNYSIISKASIGNVTNPMSN
ncbi:hypothetical protein TorRG33x02_035980 [Trema orientale]|uniref:Uncharacterized protein n=1 Tax=Trema orientale TaxID=63057 RepID=A0A2P5FRZ4_TREOI|nr:hypothetical protein TorRG33x02_035980 [Trema orientale]